MPLSRASTRQQSSSGPFNTPYTMASPSRCSCRPSTSSTIVSSQYRLRRPTSTLGVQTKRNQKAEGESFWNDYLTGRSWAKFPVLPPPPLPDEKLPPSMDGFLKTVRIPSQQIDIRQHRNNNSCHNCRSNPRSLCRHAFVLLGCFYQYTLPRVPGRKQLDTSGHRSRRRPDSPLDPYKAAIGPIRAPAVRC